MMHDRQPAVAGAFYPEAPQELEAMVGSLLASAGPPTDDTAPPKALIVPHAGYVYSGATAACAYAQLSRVREREIEGQREMERVQRVILLGPAHRVALRGIAGPESDSFLTPLGAIPIDTAALDAIRDLPQVCLSKRAHALEHSLEVQLPFLQEVLGQFTLVPLVVGQATDAEVAEVLERLWGGDETLIVISSDLSHYHDHATARKMDAASCHAIETLDPESLDEESACGRVPVRGLLLAARRHGLAVRTLDLRNSGDTAGDREQVVGYGAWALAPKGVRATKHPGAEFSSRIDEGLIELARESIAEGLELGREPGLDDTGFSQVVETPGACFVTLRSPDGELRGCIGSLEATRSLAEDVVHNAWASAVHDPRFPPVTRDELASISIEISILQPLETIEASSLEDVLRQLRPGRDGLLLTDCGARGTLLPSVWQQLPRPRDFVGTVWSKAGLPPDHWSPTARAWRYGVKKLGPA